MTGSPEARGLPGKTAEAVFWCAAVLSVTIFLGHNALWASEDRWAEGVREMLLTRDWLHPALNWQVYLDKPQFSYWLILPFAWLLGPGNELAARLPSALMGLAGLYGVLRLGRKLYDRQTALLAGWLLLGSYGFLFHARLASAEIANMAAIILAVACFFEVEEKPRFFDYLIFSLICFVGALNKGMPALVMPFVVIAPYLFTRKRWLKHVNASAVAAFLLASAVYAIPIYFAGALPVEAPLNMAEEGLSAWELVWRENFVRVFNAFDHKDPFYSYFYNLPRLLLPWVPLTLVALAGLIRNWKRLPEAQKMLMIGTLAMFILFMLSTSRRWYYILPVLPFTLLFTAAGLNTPGGVRRWNAPVVCGMRILAIAAGSLGIASLMCLPLWSRFCSFSPPTLLVIALPVGGFLVLAVALFDQRLRDLTRLPQELCVMVVAGAIVMATVFGCVLPSFTLYRSEKPFYLALGKTNPDITGENIFVWHHEVPPKMLYYLDLRREVACADAKGGERRLGNINRFREFLEKNRGRKVAILSIEREREMVPFVDAARECKLEVDFKNPTLSQRKLEVREDKKSKTWAVWVLESAK